MNKLLIALPILALLSIGAVFVISHHEKSQPMLQDTPKPATSVPLKPEDVPTYTIWASCRNNAQWCDDMPKSQQQTKDGIELCQSVHQQFTFDFYNKDSKYPNCKQFQDDLVHNDQAVSPLPDSYYLCINDLLPNVIKSPFYFSNIFNPMYMVCAYIGL